MIKLKNLLAGSAIVVACAAFALGANAATISGLYDTGVDNNGVAVAGHGADQHWLLGGGAAYTGATNGSFPIGYWVPDTTVSRWLTPTPNAGDSFDPSADGAYAYSLTFNLTASQAAGASFLGQFASDNTVSGVTLNGNTIGGGGSFSNWTGLSASSSDFVAGANTLVFTIDNFAQNGGNPTGLNVEFLSSTMGVPEPTTWALMLVGLAGMGLALRSSRKSLGAAAAV
jgi:hypothetical protein